MKMTTWNTVFFLCLAAAGSAKGQQAAVSGAARQTVNVNREWKFMLGDHPGAQEAAYDDGKWDDVNLPHNFSIPYFQTAQWYCGYGWYRKHFVVPAAWKDRRVAIEFEGAFRVAEVFVNGHAAGRHSGGYTGFSFDITSYLKEGDNVLAVRLNNEWNPRLAPRNGDHNFTGGIYRDVYLVATNDVHVAWYGTYITTPGLSKRSGRVYVQTEIRNDGRRPGAYTLRTEILDPSGKRVASVTSGCRLDPGTVTTVGQITPAIRAPLLWHPQHPYLYRAVSSILDRGVLVDRYETTFGFRWVRWSADSGFFLNGERYYFKGANVHQDHAGWASAITNRAIERDVQMVKDCGMDFIRGSHYPHDPAFSAACDSLGVLLWEENDFWGSGGNQKDQGNWYNGAGAYPPDKGDQPSFDESVRSDLREMIRIHRNHPSIIAWSMCNEPFFTSGGTMPRVREFLKELVALAHRLDPGRMVGIGGSQRGGIDTLGDIAGYNGDGARLYLHPKVANVVTEYGSTIAVRPGKYEPGWGDLQKEHFLWRSGQALWCAFDYGTRAGDFGKMGMVDYFRLPKNMWYWYRNEYRHILPPAAAKDGVPARLKLEADKAFIEGTDGTDDVFLTVSVQDEAGRQLSNSPDVTLQIVSGPGEFPTGSSISFGKTSDIYIRDGKAAIELRSYAGGRTVIRAVSEGLQTDSIVIVTRGTPLYVEGVSSRAAERPYVRYVTPGKEDRGKSNTNIAYQKPTRSSSELPGATANLANDNDTLTAWRPDAGAREKWWRLDLENLYTVSQVSMAVPAMGGAAFKIELSRDGQHWEEIAQGDFAGGDGGGKKILSTDNRIVGRFLRITFLSSGARSALSEVAVFGSPVN